MSSVTIDPGSLAAPGADATAEDVTSYVEFIVTWSILLRERWAHIYISEKAAPVLYETDLYPIRPLLNTLLSSRNVVEFDANTVGTVLDSLLWLTPTFENFFKLKDVLASGTKTTPDVLSVYSSERLNQELEREIILSALLRTSCRPPVNYHFLVVRRLNGSVDVNVSALVHDLEHQRDDLDPPPSPPVPFSGKICTCVALGDLVVTIEPSALWTEIFDEDGFAPAIEVALYKSRIDRGVDPAFGRVGRYFIGSKFLQSVADCCRKKSKTLMRKVLRAVVETVEGLNLRDVHQLRTGKGGNDPPLMRGGDGAWRRDIDREYHLHYWACNNGAIELASVVVHNDSSIPE